MLESYRAESPSSYTLSRKPRAQSKQQNLEDLEPSGGSEYIHVARPHNNSPGSFSSGRSPSRSPKARRYVYDQHQPNNAHNPPSDSSASHSTKSRPHPYDRVARRHAYNTHPRPNIFNAHTLLCNVKLSDTLMSDRPPPKVDEYPIAPVSPQRPETIFLSLRGSIYSQCQLITWLDRSKTKKMPRWL